MHPDEEQVKNKRMLWLVKAMEALKLYPKIEECMVFEYEVVEQKTWFEHHDKDDFQAYLMCPFDVERGCELKFAMSFAHN
jgi:hypothetical protein